MTTNNDLLDGGTGGRGGAGERWGGSSKIKLNNNINFNIIIYQYTHVEIFEKR